MAHTAITNETVIEQLNQPDFMFQLTPRLAASVYQLYGYCVPIDSIMHVVMVDETNVSFKHSMWTFELPMSIVIDAIKAEYARLENAKQ